MIRRLLYRIRGAIIGPDHALHYPGMTDEADLDRARKAYADAKARGDTRDVHAASKAVRTARHAQLRMELGRG
jgi:hypothetical protein